MAGFNIVEEIFGKDPSTDTSQLPLLTPEQQQALKDLLGQLGTPAPSEAVGRQLDLTSLQALENLSQNLAQPGGGALGPANEALNQILTRPTTENPTDFEQFFQAAVADPATRQFNEQILPTLSARYAGSGFRSSDRLKQEDLAVQDLVNSLSQARGQYGFAAFENARNRSLQREQNTISAAGQAGNLTALPVQLQALIQGVSRNSEQQRIADLLAALGVRGFENLVQVNPGQQGAVSTFIQNLAAAAGSFYGGGGGLSAQTPNNNATPNIGLSNLNALNQGQNPFVLR